MNPTSRPSTSGLRGDIRAPTFLGHVVVKLAARPHFTQTHATPTQPPTSSTSGAPDLGNHSLKPLIGEGPHRHQIQALMRHSPSVHLDVGVAPGSFSRRPLWWHCFCGCVGPVASSSGVTSPSMVFFCVTLIGSAGENWSLRFA